jgi:hypothetical protein
MTESDELVYNYCKEHLDFLKKCKKDMPFVIQKYGCGSGMPNIEHNLERLHRNMYKEVMDAISKTEKAIESIIKKI